VVPTAVAQLHLLSAQLVISEGTQTKDLSSPATGATDLAVLECLQTRIRIIRAWLSAFTSLPPQSPIGFTSLILAQMYHTITCLYRLTTLRDPAWDRSAVRQSVDILTAIDQTVEMFENVAHAMDWVIEDEDDDVWTKHGKMMRHLRTIIESELATIDKSVDAEVAVPEQQVQQGYPDQVAVGGGGLGSGLPFGYTQLDVPMGGLADDQWWSDIFGPWEA
jgi:hypothetical protein